MKTSELLKYYRERNHLTQEELAEKLYISRQAVSKWERDEAMPDIENIIQLSDLYEISIDELLRGSQYLPKPFLVGEPMIYLKVGALSLFTLFMVIIIFPKPFAYIILALMIALYIIAMKEGKWVIRRDRLVVQDYKNPFDKLKSFFFPFKQKIEYPYQELKSLEYQYTKGPQPILKVYSYDFFYMILRTQDNHEYRLKVGSKMRGNIPSFTDYLIKKGLTIIDPKAIVKASLSEAGIYDSIHANPDIK